METIDTIGAVLDPTPWRDRSPQRFESTGDEIPEEIVGRHTAVGIYEAVLDQEA